MNTRLVFSLSLAAALAWPALCPAGELNAFALRNDLNGNHNTSITTTLLGSVTATESGPHGSGTSTASYGSLSVDLLVFSDGNGATYSTGSVNYGDGDVSRTYWKDLVTVDPTLDHPAGSAGTAEVKFSFTGTYSDTSASGQLNGLTGWQFVVNHSAYRHLVLNDNTQISDIPNPIVHTFDFQYGVPFQIQGGLQATGATRFTSSQSVQAKLSLRQTGFRVLSGGNAIGFSSSSSTGSSAAFPVNSGGSYTPFTLQNTSPYGHGSTASILGGVASANTVVEATFLGQVAQFSQASDIVDVTGIGHDKFVLQLSYDPAIATSLFGNEANAVLLWMDPVSGLFENAVFGNSDGGLQSQAFVGAYNPATESALGNYGVDTTNHVVWAVIDHNSEFAVGTPTPEPSQMALLVIGAAGLVMRRHRRNKCLADPVTNASRAGKCG